MIIRPTKWQVLLAVLKGNVRASLKHPSMRKVVARHPVSWGRE